MSTQTLTRPTNISTYPLALIPENPGDSEPIVANSRDYSFDFDQGELGRELNAPSPASCLDRSYPAIDAEEFDVLYRWSTT
jgi:hypothetical protein